MSGRKRLSVQIVPGPDSDEAPEAPQSSELEAQRSPKNAEGASTPRSPDGRSPGGNASRTRSRGLDENLATVISRKSAFAGKPHFHRYSLFASLFDIRAAVPADEVPRLLDRKGTKATVTSDSTQCFWTHRCKKRLVGCGRALVRSESRVHPLCFFSLLVGPFALSFESECAEAERPLMFWGKLLHLAAELTQQAWILIPAKGFRLLVPPDEPVVSNFWRDSITLGMWLFVMIHLFSSLLSIVSVMHVQNGREDAWAFETLRGSGGSIGCRRFYMFSWYYTTTTVTSIGYGDVTPGNADERLVASVVMILSQLYFAKVFADLTFLTSMYNQWTLQRHQRMTQTRSALESMNIPKQLIQRVQACQTYVWDVQKERRAKNCFEDLTTQLQEEVKLVLYSRLVIQVPFLQMVDARALRFLISRLSDQVFLPADFIICRGEIGSEMFFLREGCAGVFTCVRAPHWDDEEIKRVEKGSHFGEIALLTGQLRTAWIMARAYCLTSVLQASAIDHLMAQDPTSICTLIKNFQDMLKLKASLTWNDIKQRLDREFDPDDVLRQDLYDFVCSGDDGLAPAGRADLALGMLEALALVLSSGRDLRMQRDVRDELNRPAGNKS
ncbi:Hcn1 [Symbiodinium pilosum]|uniref:Hcn1 protein n=1 Tax=Symbiodinium pilosum TaxID=2952 RepID=A0A812IPL1_SYMPI|nr:Hcn1 [Symbiodinium pilosum]